MARRAKLVDQGNRQAAAGTVATNRDVIGRKTLPAHIAPRHERVIERGRKRMFGRQPIIDDVDRALRTFGEVSRKGPVRAGAADHERSAVEVQDRARGVGTRRRDEFGRPASERDGLASHPARQDPPPAEGLNQRSLTTDGHRRMKRGPNDPAHERAVVRVVFNVEYCGLRIG